MHSVSVFLGYKSSSSPYICKFQTSCFRKKNRLSEDMKAIFMFERMRVGIRSSKVQFYRSRGQQNGYHVKIIQSPAVQSVLRPFYHSCGFDILAQTISNTIFFYQFYQRYDQQKLSVHNSCSSE